MTPNELSQFRSRLPHCELAVYADIRSRLVLATDGALRYPQEYLDALCACAAQLFEGIPDYAGQAVEQVLFLGPTGGRSTSNACSTGLRDCKLAGCCGPSSHALGVALCFSGLLLAAEALQLLRK